ncbi:hypothetical protein [Agriterribacter sp.]|uniref:hypothetical protein n=1 Tax=Agriterribacter sp. TaxID=2821509 RepID=UPI002BA5468B|nr:hypothetical protein [Agriterribacter sp.]HTN05982.1 hypothetical protein [Agriterribacter sp.]
MIQEKYNDVLLNLLVSMHAQMQTMRDFMLTYMCNPLYGDQEAAMRLFNRMTSERKDTLIKAIKGDVALDIDDLLRRMFSGDGKEL